jgi:hypothetical protein
MRDKDLLRACAAIASRRGKPARAGKQPWNKSEQKMCSMSMT